MAENKGRNEKQNQESEEESDSNKTELANKIAHQSRKVANTYQHIEDGLLRMIRWFSSFIDHTLFNRRYTKVVALILAVLMYITVNYNSQSSLYTQPLSYSRDLASQKVTAKYNSDVFELSGLPATAGRSPSVGHSAGTAPAS